MRAKRTTIADLLLAGWHRICRQDGVWWAYPSLAGDLRFQDAAKLYRAGMKDE